MPTPGSNKFEQQKRRERNLLEQQGHPDDEAARLAASRMDQQTGETWPAARSDRALGPAGEQPARGGPGNVIDLRTPTFSPGGTIPVQYTRAGENRMPRLEWSNVPEGTTELALVCLDPDASRGVFTHWLVTGIDPSLDGIGDETTVAGAHEWTNDFGEPGYGGPQPPVGDDPHRYVFRLYALNRSLEADPTSESGEIIRVLEADHLAAGTLVGTFGR